MPSYAYKVRDFSGRLQSGFLEAADYRSAAEVLRERRLFVVELKSKKPSLLALGKAAPEKGKKASGKDLAIFCRQLSSMLDAGMPILTSLGILQQQAASHSLQAVLGKVRGDLEQGSTLSEAMGRHPGAFRPILVHMVEAGEMGGVLDEVMGRMAEHFEKEYELNQKVKGAITYPAVVLSVALLCVIFLLTYVLPNFTKILLETGAPLPVPTRIVLGISGALKRFWFLWPFLGGGGYLGVRYYLRTEGGAWQADRLALKLPVFGLLLQKIIISRFSRTLGTLLKGGVPILQALEVVKSTAGNRVVAAGLGKAQASIREGRGMAGPLKETRVFPPMVTEMIAVGEETGSLDALLEKISVFYDKEVDNMSSRLASLIEPLLIIGLGGTVGFIVVSILLPMFQAMGRVGGM